MRKYHERTARIVPNAELPPANDRLIGRQPNARFMVALAGLGYGRTVRETSQILGLVIEQLLPSGVSQ